MKNCKNCGAKLNTFKCDYCGTEYENCFGISMKKAIKAHLKLIKLFDTGDIKKQAQISGDNSINIQSDGNLNIKL